MASCFQFAGFARLSYVEFINMGQRDYGESYDARNALTFYETDKRDAKPHDIKGCSFRNPYGTAIGVYGSAGIRFYNNVVYNAADNGTEFPK